MRWISTARLAADAIRLASLLPADTSGIVGVPRSGMVPAAIIATHLHLPLWELGEGEVRPSRTGSSRGDSLARLSGRLAVVDDTVYGGSAMARARMMMRGIAAVYSAVYVRPEAQRTVDVFAVELPSPHLLEWNIVNGGPFAGHAVNPCYARGVALDLDGVIVHDAASGGVVGCAYLVPRYAPCRLIATGRAEVYRAATERLLIQLGVRWERLAMFPGGRTPDDPAEIAAFKAQHYKASGCGFFVESDPAQAAEINRLTGLPVICPAADTIYQTTGPAQPTAVVIPSVSPQQ